MSVLPAGRRLCRGLRKPVPTCCEDTVTPGRAESSVCLVRVWSASSCWANSSCKMDKLAWDGGFGHLLASQSCFSVPTRASWHGETSQQRKLLPLRTTKTSLPSHPSSWFPDHDLYRGYVAPQDKLWRSWQESWVSTAPKRRQTTQGKHLWWPGEAERFPYNTGITVREKRRAHLCFCSSK